MLQPNSDWHFILNDSNLYNLAAFKIILKIWLITLKIFDLHVFLSVYLFWWEITAQVKNTI